MRAEPPCGTDKALSDEGFPQSVRLWDGLGPRKRYFWSERRRNTISVPRGVFLAQKRMP